MEIYHVNRMRNWALSPFSFDDSDLFEMKRAFHGRDFVTDNWIEIHPTYSAHNFFFVVFHLFSVIQMENVVNMSLCVRRTITIIV